MVWSQLEATPTHVTYLTFTFFLILYALFSLLIRNRLHLLEPPLATIFGIIVGPRGLRILTPYKWGFSDNIVQEFTRIIVGVQCFAIGLELPEHYFTRAGSSIGMLLGPVMMFGWVVCAVFIGLLFKTDISFALVISACLTPTDPVLAASVLSNTQFSSRIPLRTRELLSAESGCNDGVSFPFLYLGLSILTRSAVGGIFKKWFLVTIFYQCTLGTLLGLVIGHTFNRIFKFSLKRDMIGRASYPAFYLLILGVDDFLVAFCDSLGFSYNGNSPFADSKTKLPVIIDLMLNSTLFIFFGTMILWKSFDRLDTITPLRLVGALVLILLFRRIPIVFPAHKLRLIPEIKSTREALFCGHFGPMGVGALFLAIEARAELETGTNIPSPHPPDHLPNDTMVHGLSTLGISIGVYLSRPQGERTPLIGAEREGLHGMVFHDEEQPQEDGSGGHV
ncbi:Na/H antiporter-like protein [Lojkania enalia]|uniref:Na/H antiporter-like protein n=1 Tax=Lojkania enalia TaxID=147567 RepID=A0A9P4K204_9PLEO|nr:Na/H antiporter-like protein [Didymosphaeria enalia]